MNPVVHQNFLTVHKRTLFSGKFLPGFPVFTASKACLKYRELQIIFAYVTEGQQIGAPNAKILLRTKMLFQNADTSSGFSIKRFTFKSLFSSTFFLHAIPHN